MEENNTNIVQSEMGKEVTAAQNQNEKNEIKKKKKHVSALVAASMARSAVGHVNPHSANNFVTGTNFTYNEENGL